MKTTHVRNLGKDSPIVLAVASMLEYGEDSEICVDAVVRGEYGKTEAVTVESVALRHLENYRDHLIEQLAMVSRAIVRKNPESSLVKDPTDSFKQAIATAKPYISEDMSFEMSVEVTPHHGYGHTICLKIDGFSTGDIEFNCLEDLQTILESYMDQDNLPAEVKMGDAEDWEAFRKDLWKKQ